jgi:hypothetical protein
MPTSSPGKSHAPGCPDMHERKKIANLEADYPSLPSSLALTRPQRIRPRLIPADDRRTDHIGRRLPALEAM